MESDLAAARDGISERFVPDRDRGRLIEAEHISRYRWAAQIAEGRAVLDAGCGTGYGSAILAGAGAREVVGVDVAGDVLAAVAVDLPETVMLQTADLTRLEFGDDRFDLVVCFETLEHLADPHAALDELARVLTPEGVLLLSSPNRLTYPAGNPHHRHEFAPAELETALSDRFPSVRILRQSAYLTAAILDDVSVAAADGDALDGLRVHKLHRGPGDRETYTVAVAGHGELPQVPALAALADTLELREWLAVSATQTQAIADKDAHIAELEQRLGERERLADLLTEAELKLAGVPELHDQIAALEQEMGLARRDAEVARREAADLDRALLYGRRLLRHVRPAIQLLRKVRRRLRST